MSIIYLFLIILVALQLWVQSLGGGIALMILALLAALGTAFAYQQMRNKKLDEKVAAAGQQEFLPLAEHEFNELLAPEEELFFEIDRVKLYEASPACLSRSFSASPQGNPDPAHLHAGGIDYWDPDMFAPVDRGRLMATSQRLIFQGRAGQREWPWTRVGGIRYDYPGFLIWRRSGRVRGLGLSKPDPKLFAFVKAQLGV